MKNYAISLAIVFCFGCTQNSETKDQLEATENKHGYLSSEADLMHEISNELFNGCSTSKNDSIQLISNEYLELEIPAHWTKYGINSESSMQY